MFDGLDLVVLPATDTDRLVDLYAGVMGFTVLDDDADPDRAWDRLLDLPAPVERVRRLAKPGATGGALVLLEVAGLDDVGAPGAPARRGPYALDFFARDSDDLERRLEEAGWTFTSEPVDYSLPGTDIPVRERMLVQGVSGLLHAIVQHRPMGTRSVLGQVEHEQCSEVVAAVCLAPELDAARAFAAEALGGREYLRGDFAGPEVERMLAMHPGEALDGALFRGPTSANARLEFAWRHTATPADPVATPRVVLGLQVEDLHLADSWSAHGTGGEIVALRLGDTQHEARTFVSRYDTTFLLLTPARR
ncbi:MAG: hypothetical protein P1U38_08030 [Aeromicrobium sp.]|mgnify:CR=1 FL=1|uniref:VOC family protein n=1 Tax=Aeromicrobium sp. TaxID=1871063 RepID=UPI0025C16D51|nr:VOC family protein [Aeromicrobium sp.]MCK5891467.1 hypothetical protein [Aeromicrobium sp.]MDF1704708.1 hypothetical protein [Aeromicrobium sp.]